MRPHLHAVAVGILLLVSGSQFSACSVFSTVGDAISGQYENTVAYFNAYYNAKRLFSEAEDEILIAERAARAREAAGTAASAIPGTAKTKLGLVIDKCSNILAFHPTAALVDDALFLVGRSFLYLGEHLKAERKFAELLSQYPTSSLRLDAQYWFARCQERLNKLTEAKQSCDLLLADAEQEGRDDLEAETRLLSAAILKRQGQSEQAAEELMTALGRSPDDDMTIRIRLALGDAEVAAKRFEPATVQYLAAAEETGDVYESYYANLQAAIAFRSLGRYDDAQKILDDLSENFRYREWMTSIQFERGNTLMASDRLVEAVDAYRIVDTAQVRNEYSTRAAFELARINERQVHDYSEARRYYSRAANGGYVRIVDECKRKTTALNRYFETQRRLRSLDSLWTLQTDTLARVPADTLTAGTGDSSAIARADSLRPGRPKVIMDADSVRRVRSTLQQDMGDVFYAELDVPDSAVAWYTVSMMEATDSIRTPRVLYILAEIARTNPDQPYVPADERYRTLIEAYPNSEYAAAARHVLGQGKTSGPADAVERLYEEAEALADSGKTAEALQRFQSIADQHPASPFAPKSDYAIAWLYENQFQQPDSAVERYRRVTVKHAKTVYASAAARRFVEVSAKKDSVAADSTRRPPLVSPADSLRIDMKPASLDSLRARPTHEAVPSRRERRPAEEVN